jgi:gas vesicle protein
MTKKLYIFFLTIFLLSVFSVGLVSAEDSSSTVKASPAAWRQKIQEKFELKKEQIQEKRVEIKTKLTEKVKNRISKLGDHAKTRLQRRIDRLNRITDHLEDRMAKLAEKGFDISGATAKISEARIVLDNAEIDLKAVDDKLDELLESEEPKKTFAELKEVIKIVREDLKTARTTLSEAVQSLKAQGGEDVE